MLHGDEELLGELSNLLRLQGFLDPTGAVPGLGMSLSESMALQALTSGDHTQSDLALQLGLEKSTVSRLVDSLLTKGLASKERTPGNRRYQLVSLTDHGRQAAEQVRQTVRERHQRLLSALTIEEQHCLEVGVRALVRAITQEFGEPQPQMPTSRISRSPRTGGTPPKDSAAPLQ